MADTISTKRFVAIHEAGHAVAADFYSVSFAVTIVGTPHVQLGPIDPELQCIVTVAGPLAQAKFQRRSLAAVYLGHGGEDLKYLMEQAAHWASLVPGDRFEVWAKSAKEIIKQHWKAVQEVATHLQKVGTLSSSQVRRIVTQTCP